MGFGKHIQLCNHQLREYFLSPPKSSLVSLKSIFLSCASLETTDVISVTVVLLFQNAEEFFLICTSCQVNPTF